MEQKTKERVGMFSSIRRHLNYANIVATLALLFAMSGGALAATHYIITSKNQISPKVRKELKGANGKNGATGSTGLQGTKGDAGAAGANGTNGTNGVEGKEGKEGKQGPPGPFVKALPSEESERGVWNFDGEGYSESPGEGKWSVPISFHSRPSWTQATLCLSQSPNLNMAAQTLAAQAALSMIRWLSPATSVSTFSSRNLKVPR
jgi:hypothetical protein